MRTNTKVAALAASATLIMGAGLCSCGTQPATSSTASNPSNMISSKALSAELVAPSIVGSFGKDAIAWTGQSQPNAPKHFYAEDPAANKASYMVFYPEDATYSRYEGPVVHDGENVSVTDEASGKVFAFVLRPKDGEAEFRLGDSAPVMLSPMSIEGFCNTFTDTLSNAKPKDN